MHRAGESPAPGSRHQHRPLGVLLVKHRPGASPNTQEGGNTMKAFFVCLILAGLIAIGGNDGWEDYCESVDSGSIQEVEVGDCS